MRVLEQRLIETEESPVANSSLVEMQQVVMLVLKLII